MITRIIIISILGIVSACGFSSGNNEIERQIIVNPKQDQDSLSGEVEEEVFMDIPIEYLIGKINPENDSLFLPIPRNRCRLKQEYLHRDALQQYLDMYDTAIKENVNLEVISVTRTFREQQIIWETRWDKNLTAIDAAKKVLKYIAMPGTSRHHWGTEIDVLSSKLAYYNTEKGKREYQWLVDNAHKFGFYQVYTAGREHGYNEEKWHWTYLPVSKHYLKQYREKVDYSNIVGFPGWETAEKLDVIEKYVFGINPLLLEDFE
jgi:zinc D-Ala-D-Ala carboxypeptidase